MWGSHLESDARFVAAISVRREKSNHQINTHLAISIHDPATR
jgi:hypothetical protein